MSAHQEYADAIAAYALNALDAADARALEAHLSTCADCRAELDELRRVVGGIGLSAIAEEPPRELRTRIVNRARDERRSQPSSAIVPWMIAAASIALVGATGFYAMMQRQQVVDALNGKAAADARVSSLQRQLSGLSERMPPACS